MDIMSRPHNDLTLSEKHERLKNELESLYASANFGEIEEFTASESDEEDDEETKSEENLPPENLPAKSQRRNVMIKQSDYSRRKRPGGSASANKKTSSAWVTALSSSSSGRNSGSSSSSNNNNNSSVANAGTGSSRHIDHTGTVAERGGRVSESDKTQERNGGKSRLDNVLQAQEETRPQSGIDNDEISIDIFEMELADEPEVKKGPPRRTRSSELGNSTHSNGSSGRVALRRSRSNDMCDSSHSHGSSGRVPPRRRKSTSDDSTDSNGSSGRIRLRRTRSGDLTKPSNSTAGSANNSTDRSRRQRPTDDSKSASSSSGEGDSSNGGTRRTRRGRRSGGGGPEQGSSSRNKSDGNSDNKLDGGDNYIDDDDGSIISNPGGSGFAAMGSSASSATGSSSTISISALQKLKAAAKIAATSDIGGGNDDEIPKSSTRSSSRGQSSHREGSGKERVKAVATGLLFINKTKKLTEERRRSGSGRDRSDSRRRSDGGERRRESGEHSSRRRTEGDRRSRSGTKEASGDGRRNADQGHAKSSSPRSPSDEGEDSNTQSRRNTAQQDPRDFKPDGDEVGNSRRRSQPDLQNEGVEPPQSSGIVVGEGEESTATDTRDSKVPSTTSSSSSSRGRKPSKWSSIKGGLEFINKTKSLSKSNHRSQSLERKKNVDNDNQEQNAEKHCPPSPGLTRSNSDGSINVANLASPSGRVQMRTAETKDDQKTASTKLKNAISKSMTSTFSIPESENNSTKPSTNLKGLLAKAVEQNTNEKKKSSKWTALKGGVDFANRLTRVVKAKQESGTNNSSSSDKKKSSSLEGINDTDGTGSTEDNGKKGSSMWSLASKLSTTTKKKQETEVVMDYGLMMSVSSFSSDAMEGLNDIDLPKSSTIEEGDEDEEESSEGDGEDNPGPTTVTSQPNNLGKLGPSVDSLFDLMDGGTGATPKTQVDAFDLPEGQAGNSNGTQQKNSSDLINANINASHQPDAFALFGESATSASIKRPGAVDRRQVFSKLAEPSMRFDFDKTNEKLNNLSHPETIEEGDEEEDEDDGDANETLKVNGSSNLRGLLTMAMDHMDAIEEDEEEEESESSDCGIQNQPSGGIVINTGTRSKWAAVKNSIMFTSLLNANIAELEQQKENEDSLSSPAGAADDCPNVDFGLMMSMEDFSADAMEGLDDLDVREAGEDNDVDVIQSVDMYNRNVAYEKNEDNVVDRSQEQPARINSPESESERHEPVFAPASRIVTPEKSAANTIHNIKFENEDEFDDSSCSQENDEIPLRCLQLCIVPGRKGGSRLPMAVHKLEEETNDGVRLMSVNGKQMNEKEIVKNGLFRMGIPPRKKEGKKQNSVVPKREADCKPKGPEQVFGWARTPSTRKMLVSPMPKGRGQDPKLELLRAPVLVEADDEEDEEEAEERKAEPVMVSKQHMARNKQLDIMIKFERMHRALRESRARSSTARSAIQTMQQEIKKQQSRLKELEGLRQASIHDLERKNVAVKRI